MNNTLGRLGLGLALLWTGSSAGADTLQQIYQLALKNDATLKAAEATYRANRETENIALSALLPQVSFQGQYRDTETETDGLAITSIGPPPVQTPETSVRETETTSLTLSLSQQIFDLPAWFSFQSGQETSKQAKAQLAADQQELIVRVAEAYFNVLRARENLEASLAEERAVKRQLEQTQQRFDVGLIPITDVHEARAAYDNTLAQRLGFEANLGTAREALSVLTGQMHGDVWLLTEGFPITPPTPASRDEWVQFALKNNYDLKAATYGAEAANQGARAKKMEHLPKVSAGFSYSEEDTEGTNKSIGIFNTPTISDEPQTESFNIQLTMPLFAGGGISASRRQAYEQYNAAFQQKISVQRQVVQQTRSLHLTVATDVQRVKARKQNIVSAESALDATQAGYEVGTRNIVDVLQSRRALYAAVRDYANTRFDYVINMLKLKRQAGTLSPQDITDLNKWLQAPKPIVRDDA